jgi:hypothetical protein
MVQELAKSAKRDKSQQHHQAMRRNAGSETMGPTASQVRSELSDTSSPPTILCERGDEFTGDGKCVGAASGVATMARSLLDLGKNRQAEEILRQWLIVQRAELGPDSERLCWPQLQLGEAMLKQGKEASSQLDEAIRLATLHQKADWIIAMILRYKAHNKRSYESHRFDDIVEAKAILARAIEILSDRNEFASLGELDRLYADCASVNLELGDPEAAEIDVKMWQQVRGRIRQMITEKGDLQ